MEAELEKLLCGSATSELLPGRLQEIEDIHKRRPEVSTPNGFQAFFKRLHQVRTCDFLWRSQKSVSEHAFSNSCMHASNLDDPFLARSPDWRTRNPSRNTFNSWKPSWDWFLRHFRKLHLCCLILFSFLAACVVEDLHVAHCIACKALSVVMPSQESGPEGLPSNTCLRSNALHGF